MIKNVQVRRWSVEVVQSLGQVDWDDYDSLEEVLSWMVTVITFDQFDDPQGEAGVHIMYTSVEYYACGMHRYMYMFVLKSALAVEQLC